MTVKILIPYNFTANDEKSIDFVNYRYAGEKRVDITLFHAYSPVPEIDTLNNPIMEKVVSKTSYLRRQQEEQKNVLEQARQKLMNLGFNGDHIHCLFVPIKQDIADDVIMLMRTHQFNTVILNRNPGNILNYFSRSI